jgi:hypothetical protein
MQAILPTYSQYIHIEKKTLQYLYGNAAKSRALSPVSDRAMIAILAIEKNKPFSFSAYWDCDCNGRQSGIYVGAEIHGTSKSVDRFSYYIAVVDHSPPKILRKFHFDYDNIQSGSARPKPYFHLQYGGKLHSFMQDWSDVFDPNMAIISEPRISFVPVSLAMVLNMVFYEFPTEETKRIRDDSNWRAIIKQNETALLKPYYERCIQIIGNNDSVITFDKVYARL